MRRARPTPYERLQCGMRAYHGETLAALASEYHVAESTVKTYVRNYRKAREAVAAAWLRAQAREAARLRELAREDARARKTA